MKKYNFLQHLTTSNCAKEIDVPDGIQSLIKHNQVKIYRVTYCSFCWFVLKSNLIRITDDSLVALYEKYRLFGNRLKENS